MTSTDRPLRVLVIASLFPDQTSPNFGVFVERQLLEAAKDPRVEITVIAPIGIAPWPLSLHSHYRKYAAIPRQETWKGLTVYRPRFTQMPGTGGRFAPAAMARAVMKQLRAIGRNDFDVIDAQFFFPDGPAAIRVGEALGLPVSIKARGSDIHYWGQQPQTAKTIVEAARKASGLLAVSETMKRDMVAMGMPEHIISVHYTGLDQTRFQPIDRMKAKQRFGFAGPVISTVGTVNANKGQDIVIRALTALPEVTYAIAGTGPDLQRYEQMAQTMGVADRVTFLGSVPHDDVPTLLAASDTMVLVSESEGLANAWLEALACGSPVVMSNVGGAPELADGTKGAFIVERTPEAVAEKVRAILAHPPAPETVAASVHDRFSWHKNARELVDHWMRIRI